MRLGYKSENRRKSDECFSLIKDALLKVKLADLKVDLIELPK